MSYPLDQVIATNPGGFVPESPDRHPWHQPTLGPVQVASTGNVITVPFRVADRAHVHGLGRPSWEQDFLEPFDWTPAGWGVASP